MTPGNKNIVLVTGKPASGKTTSLMYLNNQERIAYLNSDLKELPFKSKFKELNIIDPKDVLNAIAEIEMMDTIDSAVLDTLTVLMNQFEAQYVHTHTNSKGVLDTMGGWSEYAKFYMEFIQAIKSGTKSYAIMAHEADQYNEKELVIETKVPIKGAVGKVGAEADFTTIIAAKKVSVASLNGWENDLLSITPEEQEDGFKYVFQTRIDSNTIGEKIRSAMGLWDRKEKFINNDINLVFARLREYYA